jgi:ABC-type dipeptide/oligopeptide/nickel transport system permease component
MSLINYIVKRLISLIPVLLGILTITFFLSRLLPGDPALAYLFNAHDVLEGVGTPEVYEQIRRQLWLDQPVILQYFKYIADLFTGNWGRSVAIRNGQEVWPLIMQRLPRTLDVAIFSMIIASFLGVKAGITSGTHRNKFKDTAIRGVALIGVSIPVFYLGILLQYIFGYRLDWFPTIGFKNMEYIDPPFITGFRLIDSLLSGKFYLIPDYLLHLFLPVLCLSFITLAGITRQSRSSMLEVLEEDYVRTARAKGCRERDVIHVHAKRNSLIPTVTVIGLNFATVVTGAVLTETTFNLKGVAQLLVDAIRACEYWIINALVFVFTLIFVFTNLAIDVIYAIIDPRIIY